MRHLGRQSRFTSSSSPLLLASFVSLSLLISRSVALVLPQVGRDVPYSAGSFNDIATRAAEAEIVGPGLLADLTLGTGLSIGCVAAAYAGILVLVAVVAAALSPSRKRSLTNGADEAKVIAVAKLAATKPPSAEQQPVASATKSPVDARNFSYPSPRTFVSPPAGPTKLDTNVGPIPAYEAALSYSAITLTPTSDPLAQRKEVMERRTQAHDQLADLYKLVLQQDEARVASQVNSPQNSNENSPTEPLPPHRTLPQLGLPPAHEQAKRTKTKPAILSLDKDRGDGDKRKSKGVALLSALLSPRRKSKGLSISSPLMTPSSATHPQHQTHHQDTQEMHPLSPRHYIPMPPPPIPTVAGIGQRFGFGPDPSPPQSPPDMPAIDQQLGRDLNSKASQSSLRVQQRSLGPHQVDEADEQEEDQDFEHEQQYQHQQQQDYDGQVEEPASIESRLGPRHSKNSAGHRPADIEISPISMQSQSSQVPLIGLPLSPKPNSVRFSGLPQSPKPGATFHNQVPSTPRSFASASASASPNGNSAVRANGTLALRAYEPSGDSVTNLQYKQTVFERTGILSPTTPGTAVPYTPYQPFTPCIPMTPSLITKEDRKRMRKLEPKTPTLEMVEASDEVW